jgi:thiosulfate dehydrogenase (quinone) large subunit
MLLAEPFADRRAIITIIVEEVGHMQRQQSATFQWAVGAITVIAGAWTVFHIIWNLTNHTTDDYWGQALLVLFIVSLLLSFTRYFQERQALRASTAGEQFPEPAIAKFYLGSTGAAELWFVLRMNVGAQWLLAGYDKLFGSESAGWATGKGLAGFVAFALKGASGTNPSVQGWYANFLQYWVLPHASLFAFLVSWGEFAVGLGVLVGALTGIAAGFGILMNLNYLLSGVVSINPVLGMFGLFLVFAWRVAGYIGLDYWLLPAIGMPWKPGRIFTRASLKPTAPLTTS